jgi:hypothetical protein
MIDIPLDKRTKMHPKAIPKKSCIAITFQGISDIISLSNLYRCGEGISLPRDIIPKITWVVLH